MNRDKLKLDLIELFSQQKPVPIELTSELFDLFKREFWDSFKSCLKNSVKNNHRSFTITKACVNWWNTSGHRLYNLYKDSSDPDRNAAFAAFMPVMVRELEDLGIPYVLEDCYTPGLKIFKFDLTKLREFSNVERLGILR